MISQLAAPATSAAVTPISRTATRPTSPAAGPTEARPAPSGPPEIFAQNPMTTAVSVPVSSPHSGAASSEGVGAIRTVISPASAAGTA